MVELYVNFKAPSYTMNVFSWTNTIYDRKQFTEINWRTGSPSRRVSVNGAGACACAAAAGAGGRDVFTCRWRLVLSRRAWNELGVSMVCCRERVAWGALTELWRNQGSEILRRLLCGLSGGGGVVPIAPARHVRGPAARADESSRRSRLRTGARRYRHCRRHGRSLSHSLTTQPPYRATLPEFIPQRLPPQSRAKVAPNPFASKPAATGDGGATSLAVYGQRNGSQLSRAADYMSEADHTLYYVTTN